MNPFDLSGRVAIVTGGNGGIGLGMARGLENAGAAVIVAGRFHSWDRGFDASGKQVWGATAGPYEFVKQAR